MSSLPSGRRKRSKAPRAWSGGCRAQPLRRHEKGDDIVGIDASAVHYKEINVTGSSGGSPWDIARTLELIASEEIDPGAHITRVGDLEHAIELLKLVKVQQIDGKAAG